MNLCIRRFRKALGILVMALMLVALSPLIATDAHAADCEDCAAIATSAPGQSAQDIGCGGCGHPDEDPCKETCPPDCVQPCCSGFILHDEADGAVDTLHILHENDRGRRIARGLDLSEIFVPPEFSLSS